MEQDHLPEKGEEITEIKTTSEIYVCKLIFKSIYVTEKPLLSAVVFSDGSGRKRTFYKHPNAVFALISHLVWFRGMVYQRLKSAQKPVL